MTSGPLPDFYVEVGFCLASLFPQRKILPNNSPISGYKIPNRGRKIVVRFLSLFRTQFLLIGILSTDSTATFLFPLVRTCPDKLRVVLFRDVNIFFLAKYSISLIRAACTAIVDVSRQDECTIISLTHWEDQSDRIYEASLYFTAVTK